MFLKGGEAELEESLERPLTNFLVVLFLGV